MTSEPDGPRLVLPDDDDPQAPGPDGFQPAPDWARPVAAEPSFNPIKSVIGSAGLALVGAGIWAGITLVTNYQLGLIAIAVGFLAGLGATWGGRGQAAQVIGAAMAAVGYFAGQFMIAAVMFTQTLSASADLAFPEDAEAQAQLAAEGAEDVNLDKALNLDAELSAEELDQLMEAAAAEEANLAAPTPAEPNPGFGLFGLLTMVMGLIVQDTFTSLGVVFLAIAVWEGWRLPSAQHA